MHSLIDVILKPTSKSYKSHYISNWAFARTLTSDQKIDQGVQINNFPRIHSDVPRESYSFELFDPPLDVLLVWRIHGLCIPVDSFDLRCESVTYNYTVHEWIMVSSYIHTYIA